MLNHYLTLGVPRSSTLEEIKAAHRAFASKLHPDHTGDVKKIAKMVNINVAYGVLKDVAERKRYDKQLRLIHGTCGHCKGTGVTMKQKGFSKKVATVCSVCKGGGHEQA